MAAIMCFTYSKSRKLSFNMFNVDLEVKCFLIVKCLLTQSTCRQLVAYDLVSHILVKSHSFRFPHHWTNHTREQSISLYVRQNVNNHCRSA
jgi:hypothetical protein